MSTTPSQLPKLYFVYRLESLSHSGQHYTGFTEAPEQRLREHNEGKLPNTARYRPWRIGSLHGFPSKALALAFESYLKSGSGRTFAIRHLDIPKLSFQNI